MLQFFKHIFFITCTNGQFFRANFNIVSGKSGYFFQVNDKGAVYTQKSLVLELSFQIADLILRCNLLNSPRTIPLPYSGYGTYLPLLCK